MSRIGQAPVPIPAGVQVSVEGRRVRVEGPKGSLERTVHERVSVAVGDGSVVVARADDEREARALHGLTRALVANMVKGVTEGYRRELSIVGVGYRVALKGGKLELSVGYSQPVEFPAPEGITFEVPDPSRVIVSGLDKELVGQVAADVRAVRRPEPYKGKGIRYAGETVRRKAGKAGKR